MLSGYGRWVRWALLGMTLAISMVLATTLWLSYRSMDHAAVVITDSQGKALIHATHNALHTAERRNQAAVLSLLVDQDRAAGRRYVAIVADDGQILAEAGEPVDRAWAQRGPIAGLPLDRPYAVGPGVLRIVDSMPGPLRGEGARSARRRLRAAGLDDGQRGPPDADRPPRRLEDGPLASLESSPSSPGAATSEASEDTRRHYLMTEFAPLLTNDLRSEARRTLLVGGSATIALIVAALVLVRILRQRDALEVRLERGRRLSALGEMSAVLAHEIRNPLASLKGNAQLLLESLPSAGRDHKKADRVVREAQRLEALCTDLLDFVRAGQIERRAVDPAALLLDSVEAVSAERFDVDLDAAPASFPLDPGKMQQVLVNMLDNALKASAGDARATATARAEGDQLVFEVRDHGEGIPAGEEERIFEPFHTRRVRGTGLGLAVARRIVELHHGVIVARNHPEGGALFRVSIPRA